MCWGGGEGAAIPHLDCQKVNSEIIGHFLSVFFIDFGCVIIFIAVDILTMQQWF